MTKLALIEGSTIVGDFEPGGFFILPNGDKGSPAADGWTDDTYRLETILEADPVPPGKLVVSTSIQMVNGHPQYVDLVEDFVAPVPEIISRRQFYEQLEIDGLISQAEALAAMKTGTLPAALQAIVDGMADADAKYDAEMKLVGATDFFRSSSLVMVFAIVIGWDEARVDKFWIDAEAR